MQYFPIVNLPLYIMKLEPPSICEKSPMNTCAGRDTAHGSSTNALRPILPNRRYSRLVLNLLINSVIIIFMLIDYSLFAGTYSPVC